MTKILFALKCNEIVSLALRERERGGLETFQVSTQGFDSINNEVSRQMKASIK